MEQETVVQNRPSRTQRRWLTDFDRTTELVRPFVMDHFGEAAAKALYRDARKAYQGILPQVSWIRGQRAPIMNAFLRGTAQEIALFMAVKARGGTAPGAWEICHEANRLKMEHFPRWER